MSQCRTTTEKQEDSSRNTCTLISSVRVTGCSLTYDLFFGDLMSINGIPRDPQRLCEEVDHRHTHKREWEGASNSFMRS